jgi:hypothetical protein
VLLEASPIATTSTKRRQKTLAATQIDKGILVMEIGKIVAIEFQVCK